MGDGNEEASANTIYLALGTILDALPDGCVQEAAGTLGADARRQPIPVIIEDLFEQLATGAVRISTARLVFAVPVGLVTSPALRDDRTRVDLPLSVVVAAIGENRLRERTSREARHYATENLPPLFARPEASPPPLPPVVDVPATPAEVDETPPPVAAAPEPPPDAAARAAVVAPPTAEARRRRRCPRRRPRRRQPP